MAETWQSIDCFLTDHGVKIGAPEPGQTTRTGDGSSLHAAGRARDYGTVGSDPASVYAIMLPFATDPNGPVEELFWDPSGHGWKNGRDIGPIGGHSNHCHVGLHAGATMPCQGTPGALGDATHAAAAGSDFTGAFEGCLKALGGLALIVASASAGVVWWHPW